jgi:GT2 family glycosyltransferase
LSLSLVGAEAVDAGFTVVVCTRDRPDRLTRTLEALERQSFRDFDIVVVDNSENASESLTGCLALEPRFRVLRLKRPGLSRARNEGWRAAETEWVAFLDDDCVPDLDWAEQLNKALGSQPVASLVSGTVRPGSLPAKDYPPVATQAVERDLLLAGRWVRPWHIGLGCTVVPRRVLERLGGFDERLGSGAPEFPSAEDMDFNYRLLIAGGVAHLVPSLRVTHEQWRTREQLGPHYAGYWTGWCGFSMKHLYSSSVVGGLWLWSLGAGGLIRMVASSARRRSLLRFSLALHMGHGILLGTWRGARRRW